MAPKLAAVYEVSVCLATHRVVSAVTRGWVGAVPLRIACSHALLASCAWCRSELRIHTSSGTIIHRRYSFHATDPPCGMTVLPLARSRSRHRTSSGLMWPPASNRA